MNKPLEPPAMDEAAFEEYLSRQSPVSQTYRDLDGDDVPSQLDEAVLGRARDALNQRSTMAATELPDELARVRNKRRRLMQWAIPTAIAASSLLVISIVIRSGVQHEVLSLPQAKAPAAASPATMADAKRVDAAAQAEADKSVVLVAPLRQIPPDVSMETSTDKREAIARADQDRKETQRALVLPPPPTPPDYRSGEEANTLSRGAMQSDQPALAASSAPSAPVNVAAPATSITAPTSSQPERKAAAEEESTSLDEIAVTGYRARMAHPSGPRDTVPANSGTTSGEPSETERLHDDPQAWLEHIRELRREGRPIRANREWRQFSKQYPDYEVAETDLARGKPGN